MRGHGREISSGLRAFCKEISWKIGGKKVGPDLTKRGTRLRQCIHVNKRVAVALWRLATGDTCRYAGAAIWHWKVYSYVDNTRFL